MTRRNTEAELAEAATASGARLLVLFGSRARGDHHPGSDWDLGYLPGPHTDAEALALAARTALGSEDVDVVDLSRASALLRFRAAAEGRPIHEFRPGAFQDFQIEASRFWCDAGPVIRAAYEQVLGGLPRP